MSRLLRIYQIAEGYCYNSDSLFLWDFLYPYLRHNLRVLDIGSGSGILGLLCARDYHITLFGIEKQREYLLLSSKNAFSNRISACFLESQCSQLLDKVAIQSLKVDYQDFNAASHSMRNSQEKSQNNAHSESYGSITKNQIQSQSLWQYFDIVISNPPFYDMRTLSSHNLLKSQARQSHHLPLESLIACAKRVLKPNGKFFFCYSPHQLASIIIVLEKYHFHIDSLRFVYPKKEKNATLAMIYAKRNNKDNYGKTAQCNTQIHILPPLITHIGQNQKDNTKAIQDIYDNACTYSIKVRLEDIIWEELFSFS